MFFFPSPEGQVAGRKFWERRHRRKTGRRPAEFAANNGRTTRRCGRLATSPRRAIRRAQIDHFADALVNGHDDVMNPTINSYYLFQHIPRAELILYPDSGLGSLLQYPDLFLSHVRLLLDGLEL
jgi:hypothetical protein